MARPNRLADPDFAQAVAEAVAAGLTRQEMCDLFEVQDRDTITRWRRDPRVKSRALKLIEDRVLQVTRKVESVIAARLEYAEKMSVKELLDIRKEFGMGGLLAQRAGKADETTINEALEALEEDPTLADDLEELLTKGRDKLPGVES